MSKKEVWTMDALKSGFEKFHQEHGHYPTCDEVDNCDYLPSARQFQRRFNGLTKFREIIGLSDVHLGKGAFRSAISSKIGQRGSDAERKLEKILINHFGEPFVHIEKPINPQLRRIRYDFFIFAKNYKFGVDVFCSDTKKNIMKNLDIKIDSYRSTSFPLYLVIGDPNIPQAILDDVVISKTIKPLPNNLILVSWDKFLKKIEEIKPLEIKEYIEEK
jgi:hypothetical protein